MPNGGNGLKLSRTESTQLAKTLWENGELLDAGKLLFENLPEDARVPWALSILDLAVRWTGKPIRPIRSLLKMKKPRHWRAGHRNFDWIRWHTLRLDNKKRRSEDHELKLCMCCLAELVAKVAYNATDPFDPFDEDSGWWIPRCLNTCIRETNISSFEKEALDLLFNNEDMENA